MSPPLAALSLEPALTARRSGGSPARRLADQAFSRAAGAPLIGGNRVEILQDAEENYPTWLDAIQRAQHHVHLETYIFAEDATGSTFADALIAKAQQGVAVRVIYDWLGCARTTSRRFWQRLRAGGVEVRCYNPPRLEAPFGWLSRDHRKMLVVDGEVGFVTGLCISDRWSGDARRDLAPWRDTGVAVHGPAVAEIERAFGQVWALTGPPLPASAVRAQSPESIAPVGNVAMRIVATEPSTAGMYRVDQLVAALARHRLWLTDAYYAGTATYVQALTSAAKHGVDVRLLVPGSSDIWMLSALSRAGYRPLLEGGVRVFEWNGSMLHAKAAVADGRWARVGSTNLNMASWMGNCELDAVIEDEAFGRRMEEMFLRDLAGATEVVLPAKARSRTRAEPRGQHMGGSAGRAAASALRIGNALGAAFTDRRVLEPMEARMLAIGGALLLGIAVVAAVFPRLITYPLAVGLAWIAVTLWIRAVKLRRAGHGGDAAVVEADEPA